MYKIGIVPCQICSRIHTVQIRRCSSFRRAYPTLDRKATFRVPNQFVWTAEFGICHELTFQTHVCMVGHCRRCLDANGYNSMSFGSGTCETTSNMETADEDDGIIEYQANDAWDRREELTLLVPASSRTRNFMP
jgi:hypothetical protein